MPMNLNKDLTSLGLANAIVLACCFHNEDPTSVDACTRNYFWTGNSQSYQSEKEMH